MGRSIVPSSFADVAVHQGEVHLAQTALGEHLRQFGDGCASFSRDHNQPAGVLVQPMHDARTEARCLFAAAGWT